MLTVLYSYHLYYHYVEHGYQNLDFKKFYPLIYWLPKKIK